MKKDLYIVIPYLLKDNIITLQQQFLNSSDRAYTIIIENYKNTEDSYVDEETGVLKQNSTPIKLYIKIMEEIDGIEIVKKLDSFILKIKESDLHLIPSNLLDMCTIFDNVNKLQNYLNN